MRRPFAYDPRAMLTTMPPIGLGTWKSAPGEVGAAVEAALRLGYRHVDCAAIYGNEKEVGAALARCFADGVVTRDEVWITSKLWNDRHDPDDVVPALRETLADLQLEQLDLYLIHWPVALRKGVLVPESAADMLTLDQMPLTETWKGMEAAVELGLTRQIGVSNFSMPKLEALFDAARIKPAVDQVEMHPYLQQNELLGWCKSREVAVTAYSPLGSPDRPANMRAADAPVLLRDPTIRAIAERHGATPAQVLIAWALARGTSVIPKSVRAERLAENLAARDVALTELDLREITTLDCGRRYVDGAFWALPGSGYTVASLWDA